MANLPTVGSIEVSSPAVLGQPLTVRGTWRGGRLKNPRVEVFAYQDINGDGEVTKDIFGPDVAYGEAGPYPGQDSTIDPSGSVTTTFAPLGGGGSYWLDHGGPAQCRARLFYFKVEGTNREWNGGGQQEVVYLASVDFDAEG